jgi:hypothetical protein
MSSFHMKEHSVSAQQIEAVQPLRTSGDRFLSPDAGILLVLSDGTKTKYLAEPNVPMPVQGDWFVRDEVLATTFVVTAARFAELFQEA